MITDSIGGTGEPVPQRHVTLQDVAKEAGVHRATASRALNPDRQPLVNGNTIARVRAAADKLGYVADPVAQALRKGASQQVGVLVRTLRHPWVGDFLRGADAALTRAGYIPWITFTGDDALRVRALIKAMSAWRIEGLIVATARVPDEVIIEAAETGVPMVVVARAAPDQVCSVVNADNEGGSRTAVGYLLRLGHTRIGYIAGPLEVPVLYDRLRGFNDAIGESGVKPDARLIRIADGYSISDGEEACRDLLASGRKITAVAAANDSLAVGCYLALEKARLRVPEDVSVIGFDDLPLTAELRPMLSTMHYPGYDMGVEAADLILAGIDGEPVPKRTVLLSAGLVARQSTAPPPG
jgi:LacI family transcriptional regulator